MVEFLFPESIISLINFSNPFLWLLCAHIIFNVLYWNVTSTLQYKTQFFSKLFGDRKKAVYIHSIIVFGFGLSRNFLYKYVVNSSKQLLPLTDGSFTTILGILLLSVGTVLVSAATYKLGIIGTFNGDAYGFLLPEIIRSFPFNICGAPMYLGSTLNFLGYALIKRSVTGIFLSLLVAIVYSCGTFFEDKLTREIYSNASISKKKEVKRLN